MTLADQNGFGLQCQGVSHWFGENKVLFDLNLKVDAGQFVGLVGPSGCGKSTLLRAILGTHPPQRGKILTLQNGRLANADRAGRDRGIVYQKYSLYPFLTALDNVALGLKLDQTTTPFRWFNWPGWAKKRREFRDRAAVFLEKVGLGQAMHLYPSQMSGGMQQRVAIAQALIMEPEIILLDEPFGALDEATREELQEMLLRLYEENAEVMAAGGKPPYTLIIVTHELNEAIRVGDRLVGLSQYWDWKADGHERSPGATVVYDKQAPVFRSDERPEYELFDDIRMEIRKYVYSPEVLQRRDEHVNVDPTR
ncbi:MAG: ATP-binding cassette domain-containing protein [Verrucomicrobiota bacterium]|jgi:NitT/TauT family transport system ATP-binding protein|nr:ATP-binding cassette domain-containing protein [Verrucomicrobiota bacterium]MDP7048909.1 ATP-binding cassette domain-containing protein [Verrucomicrobiota bacterium]